MQEVIDCFSFVDGKQKKLCLYSVQFGMFLYCMY